MAYPLNPKPASGNPGPTWFVLQSGPASAAENMAWDEALLEGAAGIGRPILRHYGWTEPAATFGYFQKFAEVECLTKLRPLVRRPTGGGLVPHDTDWTYSVVIPPDDSWYDLKAVASYCRVHEWIQAALSEVRVTTALSPTRQDDGPGQCFVGAEQFDLLERGRKIAGAAQRRNRDGLLIQGSIQPTPQGVLRTDFERAFLAVAVRSWSVEWVPFDADECLRKRVAELVIAKYSRESYHQRR